MATTEKNEFKSQLECLRQSGEYSELPGPDVSMWPEDIILQDDVRDRSRFNDIFLEIPGGESVRGIYILYLFFFLHNVGILMFVLSLYEGAVGWGYLVFPAVAWVFLMFFSFGMRQGGVIFNRRMQVVHVGDGDGKAVTVAWRDVKPFLGLSAAGHSLKLFFPIPDERREEFSDEQLKKLYRGRPFVVDGGMDWRDTGVYGSLRRLEFYRRYMELGLIAVQPDVDKVGENAIWPPSQTAPRHRDHGAFQYWIVDPIVHVFCMLAGKPLIDWFLRKQAQKFKWPEEIERLCTPGADLLGIDTTPVKPRKDIFYRPCGLGGIELVNARGQRIG